MYPRKGTIAVGSDADLVIFDPNRKHTISAKTHHMRVDYSMFEGIQVTGMPDAVLSRGRVVVEGDKFLGRPGRGSSSSGRFTLSPSTVHAASFIVESGGQKGATRPWR